jgi:hypothetical protein
MKKILIAYLSSCFVDIKSIVKFVKYFKKNKPGYPYELVVCFKKLNNKEISKRVMVLKKIKYKIFIDEVETNDQEWGTLKRLCKLYNTRDIFWMNDHSYPVVNHWLKKIMKHKLPKTFIGTSGSFSSHFSNSFQRNYKDNYLFTFFKIIFFYFTVPKFPNPHIRTTGILFEAKKFLKFIENKNTNYKLLSFLIESGKKSMTKFFKKIKYNTIIVNRDGNSFKLNDMKNSLTFSYKYQNKYLISDNQIRYYSKLNSKDKLKRTLQVWGNK